MTTTVLTTFPVSGSWLSASSPRPSGTNSDILFEQVTGLVNFTPRLPRGMTFTVPDYLVTNAYNTLQQVWLIANPVDGTWHLRLEGFRTVSLPVTASASAVEAALEQLPSIGQGNVQVSNGPQAKSFNVEFTGGLAEQNVPPLIPSSNLLNAQQQNCPISVTVIYQGTPQVIEDVALSLPAISARIWRGRLCAINTTDSVGVRLISNDPVLNNKEPLIYDVSYSQVSFNRESQLLAPFAFVAPTDDSLICLTDPTLQRLPYSAPIAATWSPSHTAARTNGWRLRAV